MQKKILALIISAATALTLAGCGAVVDSESESTKRERSEKDSSTEESSSYISSEEYIMDLLPEDEFIMPDLVGMSWDEANEKYGKYVNFVAQQEYNDAEKDHIFDQDPPADRRAKLHQTVTVKVSNGRRMSEIYDFTNRPASYVVQQLEKEGFNAVVLSRTDDTVAEDYVIETIPPAHTMAEQGSTVVVVVSTGAKNDPG